MFHIEYSIARGIKCHKTVTEVEPSAVLLDSSFDYSPEMGKVLLEII